MMRKLTTKKKNNIEATKVAANREKNPPYCFIWTYEHRRFILPCFWTACPKAVYFISDFFLKASGDEGKNELLKSIVPEYMQTKYKFRSLSGKLYSVDCITVGGAQYFLLPRTEEQAQALLDFIKKECIPDLTEINDAPQLAYEEFEFPVKGDTIRVASDAKGSRSPHFIAWDVATILNPTISLTGFTDMLKALPSTMVKPVWIAGFPNPFASLTEDGVRSMCQLCAESDNASIMQTWLTDFRAGKVKEYVPEPDTEHLKLFVAWTEDGIRIKDAVSISYMGTSICMLKHNEAKWYSIDDIALALAITSHSVNPSEVAKILADDVLATYSSHILRVKFKPNEELQLADDSSKEVITDLADDSGGKDVHYLLFISDSVLHEALSACNSYDSGVWVSSGDVRLFERRLHSASRRGRKARGEVAIDTISTSDIMDLLPVSGESVFEDERNEPSISELVEQTITKDAEEFSKNFVKDFLDSHPTTDDATQSPVILETGETVDKKVLPKYFLFTSTGGYFEVSAVVLRGSLWISLPSLRELIGRNRYLPTATRAKKLKGFPHISAVVPSRGHHVRSMCIKLDFVLQYAYDHCADTSQARTNLMEFAEWLKSTVQQLADDNILSSSYVSFTVLPLLDAQIKLIASLLVLPSADDTMKDATHEDESKTIGGEATKEDDAIAVALPTKDKSSSEDDITELVDVGEENPALSEEPKLPSELSSSTNVQQPPAQSSPNSAVEAFVANPADFLKDLNDRIRLDSESRLLIVLRTALEVARRKEVEEELERLKSKEHHHDTERVARINSLLDMICNDFDSVHQSLQKLVGEIREILTEMTSDDD